MIVDQTNIVRRSLLSILLPLAALLHNFIFLQVEMPPDDRLKPLRRILYVLEHGELNVSVSHNV